MPSQQSAASLVPAPKFGQSATVVVMEIGVRRRQQGNMVNDFLPARLFKELPDSVIQIADGKRGLPSSVNSTSLALASKRRADQDKNENQ